MKHSNSELIKAIYKLWIDTLGMEKVLLHSCVECMPEINCYKYKSMFLRLDTFKEDGEVMYCIEAAENQELAQNNIFDDAWLYPESFGADKIISEMKNDLQGA